MGFIESLTSKENGYMKNTVFAIFLLFIISNVYAKDKLELYNFSGSWLGSLEVLRQPESLEKSKMNNITYLFQYCDGNMEVRFSKNGKKYFKMSGPFEIKSTNGSYLISVQNSKKGWVQTNVWSIVITSEEHAYFQLLRDVSNYKLDINNKLRYFGLMGNGSLKKISTTCDVIKK
ncbi:MAG: hypothetical protein ACC657_05900 [Thiohalomonadales bacterium]